MCFVLCVYRSDLAIFENLHNSEVLAQRVRWPHSLSHCHYRFEGEKCDEQDKYEERPSLIPVKSS